MKKYIGLDRKSTNIFIVFVLCMLIFTSVYYYSSNILHSSLESSLVELAEQGAETVTGDIKKYFAILETMAKMETIKDPDIAVDKKLDMLNTNFITEGLLRISIADVDGYSKTTDGTDLFVGDRKYFIHAKSGKKSVSDLLKSRVDGSHIFVFAVPIYFKNEIVNILYATYPAEELSMITDNINFLGEGKSFIISKKGSVLAHEDRNLVNNQISFLEEAEHDPSLDLLIDLMQQMVEGKSGIGEYYYNDIHKYMAYAPIKGTEWFFGVGAPYDTVFHDMDKFIYMISIASIVVAVIVYLLNIYLKSVKIRLNKQELLSHNVIDTAKIIIMRFDKKGKILDFNYNAEEQTGYKSSEIVGNKEIFELIKEEDFSQIEDIIKSNQQNSNHNIEFPIIGKDGREVYILWSINLYDKRRTKEDIELIGINITEKVLSAQELQEQHWELNALYEEMAASEEELKAQFNQLSYHQEEIKKSEDRYRLVVQASNVGIWDWDMIENKKFYSDKWYEIFEFKKHEYSPIEDLWIEKVHPEDREKALEIIHEHLEEGTEYYEGEYRIKTKNGDYKWVYAVGKALWDAEGNPYRMAGAYLDITEKKEYEEKIKRYAYFDEVTGLPNRISLHNQFEELQREKRKATLLYMDMDNFKFVNDSYGHAFGDLLLKEVGKRLEALEGEFMVSRLGGDEYGILLFDVFKDEDIERFCRSLIKSFNHVYDIDHIQLHISVSVGIAKYPSDSHDFNELLKHADIAMYKAKEQGKNRCEFYKVGMEEKILEKVAIQNQLRNALSNSEFFLHYQPQFNVRDNTINGFEALARWQNHKLGLVSPMKFISIAEENRSIIPLGRWILKTASQFIVQLNNNYSKNFTISINISIIQLMQDDFENMVLNILDEVGLAPNLLELELTESILMQSFDMVNDKLEGLRKAGVRIALDDFGKGYSSLSYLRQLPISTLKIDKSFIDHIAVAPEGNILIEAIVCMGKKLGLLIVAEGVETEEQFEYLARGRCDVIQGYLLGKPMTSQKIFELLEKKNKNT